jgi:FixJ family two-component response regulator
MSFTTYLVDDDPGVLKALARMLRIAGYDSRQFSSPRDFLREHDPSIPGCAILDLTMPELDGLQLQRCLADDSIDRPIIFLTGNGDIPSTVQAMKAGAIDFLTKPVRREQLLAAIARAEEKDAAARRMRDRRRSVESKLGRLTVREREVLEHVIAGKLNKQIAAILGTAEKTVKVHRGRMMAKLGVRSVAELVRFAQQADIRPMFSQTVGIDIGP